MATRHWIGLSGALIASMLGGCGSDESDGAEGSGGKGSGGTSGAAGSAGSSGSSGSSGASGASGSGGSSGASGASGSGGSGGGLPTSCAEAASAYELVSTPLDPSFVPYVVDRGWGSESFAQAPIAVADDGTVIVGFTRDDGGARSAMIVAEPASAFSPITIPDAVLGGVAATSDGVAALLFDPADVDERHWATVKRFGRDGSEKFSTDLFRSPNLDDEGTRGEPGTSRLAYVPGTDQLIAYFGHTRRYDDGVRHQGGYLAELAPSGEQNVLDDWFGSHNLDQRMLVDADNVAVLGLGDAFPKGIFYSFTDDASTNVVYLVAADGSGTANGQLGGLVALDSDIVAPFITNRSIAQDLDPGPWPNPDPTIAGQIRDAADNGSDLGLLRLPKSGAIPEEDAIEPIWIDPSRGSDLGADARLENLKSARYGQAGLIFLAWSESTGEPRNRTSAHYTMVVDRDGAVCQPKTRLADDDAIRTGDDVVRRPDGGIVWTSSASSAIRLVTLSP
jgi:hypothetical protein